MSTIAFQDRSLKTGGLLEPWLKRRDAAKSHRKRYEAQWLTAQQFAAGRQWAAYVPTEHRMIVPPLPKGRSRQTADRLTQYIMTVQGQLAGEDFRGRLLAAHHDAEGEDYAKTLDELVAYVWERELNGDQKCLKLIRNLVWLGTGGIRVRFDRQQGRTLDTVPHKDGQPILDPVEARAHVANAAYYGEDPGLKTIREGKICWDVLSPWNLLPPPGVEDPPDFPWEMIVRPVPVETLKAQYPNADGEIMADSIQSMDVLGLDRSGGFTDGDNQRGTDVNQLDEHALVYTGYLHPTADWQKGQTVTFTQDVLLDAYDSLPLPETSCQPARSGISYFWYWRIPGRLWGRALSEPGFGPQRIINKRLSQMDELIDRGMPKVYGEKGSIEQLPEGRILEWIDLKPGTMKPLIDAGIGPAGWFANDVQMQDDNITKALGVHDVALGDNPQGVTTYAGLALLRENNADKIDPITAELRLGLTDVTYNTIECVRKWPPSKQIMVVGSDDQLAVHTFGDVKLPADYMVLPAKGGTQLRTTGAEIQKINDIWTAAVAIGRTDLLDWYVNSLRAGQALDLPPDPAHEQQHMAALENILLARGQQVPVAEWQDHAVHIAEHRSEEAEWQQLAAAGDPEGAQIVGLFGLHIAEHQMAMQATQLPTPAAGATLPVGLPPQLAALGAQTPAAAAGGNGAQQAPAV